MGLPIIERYEPYNVAHGLFAIAASLDRIATQIQILGLNDAGTSMGAIEVLSKDTGEGLHAIANAIGELRDTSGQHAIAEAIVRHTDISAE